MEVMGRHQPKIIITDKNKLMVDAIKAVLPDAEVHIGISYIRQNALEHLSALYMQPGFESLFYKCSFYCRTEDEFESRWVSVVKTHGLVVYTSQEKDGLVCSSRKTSMQDYNMVKTSKIFSKFRIMRTRVSIIVHPKISRSGREMAFRRAIWRFLLQWSCPGEIQNSSAMERHAADIYTSHRSKHFRKSFSNVYQSQ